VNKIDEEANEDDEEGIFQLLGWARLGGSGKQRQSGECGCWYCVVSGGGELAPRDCTSAVVAHQHTATVTVTGTGVVRVQRFVCLYEHPLYKGCEGLWPSGGQRSRSTASVGRRCSNRGILSMSVLEPRDTVRSCRCTDSVHSIHLRVLRTCTVVRGDAAGVSHVQMCIGTVFPHPCTVSASSAPGSSPYAVLNSTIQSRTVEGCDSTSSPMVERDSLVVLE
jgi:hypothetical protein